MAVLDYKITDLDLNGKRVTHQEDVLVGSPAENKQVFDNYPDVIRNKYNQLVEYIDVNPISIDNIYPVGTIIATSNNIAPPFAGNWQKVDGIDISLTIGTTETKMFFFERTL